MLWWLVVRRCIVYCKQSRDSSIPGARSCSGGCFCRRDAVQHPVRRCCVSDVELDRIPRPNSSDVDVTGRGYCVERGIVYSRNGAPIRVSTTGHVRLTGAGGVRKIVGLGRVLFAAYPRFYGYCPNLRVEMDHINGISTDNEATLTTGSVGQGRRQSWLFALRFLEQTIESHPGCHG